MKWSSMLDIFRHIPKTVPQRLLSLAASLLRLLHLSEAF